LTLITGFGEEIKKMGIGRKKIIIISSLFVLAGLLILSAGGIQIFIKKRSDALKGNSSGAEEGKNKSAEIKSASLAVRVLPYESIAPVPINPVLSSPAIFKEEISLSNKNWKYAFYAPADIDMNKEQVLVIGLHGFGDKAKDYIRFWQSDADKNGFLVAALQAYPKIYPNGSAVESYPWLEISDFTRAALANIEKKYKIDANKIFLAGYSTGATASYILALDSGLKFRGVILIDGYLPLDAGIIDKLSRAKNVNFYIVHEADQADAKAAAAQEKILLQYGAKMEFKMLKGVGHEYPAAEQENILKWMKKLM